MSQFLQPVTLIITNSK